MDQNRIVIAGGSGAIGRRLLIALSSRGLRVVTLTRQLGEPSTWTFHTPFSSISDERIPWDGRSLGPWRKLLDGAVAVFNLAGRNIDCRFTPENRRQILASRVESTRIIGEAISECRQPPKVWLQACGAGIYGDTGSDVLDEASAPFPVEGNTDQAPVSEGDFLRLPPTEFIQQVCIAWERELCLAITPGTRKVALRSSPVFDRWAGAFPKLRSLAKWGLGGQAGNGRQLFSWIHVEDWVSAALFLLDSSSCEGAFNLASPTPMSNADLMDALRKAASRPWSPPAPAPIVRLGARLLGTEGDLALQSLGVMPGKLLEAGFGFAFPTLESAIENLKPYPSSRVGFSR